MGRTWFCYGVFHSAKTYALSRIQFDHPIASYQLVQNKLAWMLREITKGQLLAYHLGRKKDDGTWFNEQISLAKDEQCRYRIRDCESRKISTEQMES